jgi:hypothetical protein
MTSISISISIFDFDFRCPQRDVILSPAKAGRGTLGSLEAVDGVDGMSMVRAVSRSSHLHNRCVILVRSRGALARFRGMTSSFANL